MPRKNNGFTILEISIVLAVIALIIGSIFLAQSMIRNAQVLSVIDDTNTYKQAIQLFKDKYQYLPGDMPTAETFWGSDTNCPYTPYIDSPRTSTCNGNGDGHIASSTDSTWQMATESTRAWQQLANAGLIAGSYSGTNGVAVGGPGDLLVAFPGVNVPASQIPGGGFSLWYINNASDTSSDWAGIGHILMFGGADANRYTDLPVLTTTEAYGIDTKIDDGLPATGNVRSEKYAPADDNCNAGAQYNTGSSLVNACALVFYLGF